MAEPARRIRAAAGLALLLAVWAVFAPLIANPFVDLDDDSYVTRNPHVSSGLGGDNLVWAFTSFHSSNWHPLTWLSHQLDVTLWGLDPAGHHRTSVWLHVANTLLVLLLFERMTGAFWPSLALAALFGLHPQRLESVAWVAERKDLLSSFFGLLTLYAWAGYVQRPARARYIAALIAFALSLMAKPMLVTLPFVLLLLEIWPLGRWPLASTTLRRRSVEMIPFFALSLSSCVMTVLAQRAGGSISTLSVVPFAGRLANAVTAYGVYLFKLVWPKNLAIVYPLPRTLPAAHWIGAAALLVALTAVAVVCVRKRPWVTVGWLWYLGTLVPVIGLVQVGSQAFADRYTYLPLLGIGVVISWSAAELASKSPRWRMPLIALGVAAAVALGATTVREGRNWSSTERLFAHSLAVTGGSALIHNNYGALLQRSARREEAALHFRAAVAMDPTYATARKNLGNVLIELNRTAEAIAELEQVVRQAPDYAQGHNRLGVALAKAGRGDEAIPHLRRAVELDPGDVRAREDLVVALLMNHGELEAIQLLDAALSGPAPVLEDRFLLGVAKAQLGELEPAAVAFEAVLAVDPNRVRALNRLGIVRAQQHRLDEAIALFRRSLAIDPASEEAAFNLRLVQGTLPFSQ